MLNYIWAGLIVLALVFAMTRDIGDARRDPYRNGMPLPVKIVAEGGGSGDTTPVRIMIDPQVYAQHYGVSEPTGSYAATMTTTSRGREIRFAADAVLPPTLAKIRDATSYEDKRLTARVWDSRGAPDAGEFDASLRFEPVRLQKMKAISAAAIDASKAAVTLALGLIGVLALWLGLARIAEKAGLIALVVKVIQPILRPLFPDIPRGHPALGMIALNLTANFLGLGNAATPFGIKAMEELQTINPVKDTATNPMITFLAMNTAGVQFIPPVMLIAVIGLRAVDLIIPIWICTGLSLIVAITVSKLLARLPGYRRSNPANTPITVTGEAARA